MGSWSILSRIQTAVYILLFIMPVAPIYAQRDMSPQRPTSEGSSVNTGLQSGRKENSALIQRVPHNAGQILHITPQFAIHSGHWQEARGLPLCHPSKGMEVYVILNATPDYIVTKDWLWNRFRPVLLQVAESRCPNTHQLSANFYFKGIDIRVRTESIRNLGAPMVDDQFMDSELHFFEPYRVDAAEYPKVDPALKTGPGDENYILGFTRDNNLGEPIIIATFQDKKRWAAKFPEYLLQLEKQGKSLGGTSLDEFSPYIPAGDGSLIGYLKAKNEATQRQLAYIRNSNEKIQFTIQVLLGMMAAWECGNEYHQWCSEIPSALGSIDLAPD